MQSKVLEESFSGFPGSKVALFREGEGSFLGDREFGVLESSRDKDWGRGTALFSLPKFPPLLPRAVRL